MALTNKPIKRNAKLPISPQSESLGKTTVMIAMVTGETLAVNVCVCARVCILCLSAQPKNSILYLFKFKIKIIFYKADFYNHNIMISFVPISFVLWPRSLKQKAGF